MIKACFYNSLKQNKFERVRNILKLKQKLIMFSRLFMFSVFFSIPVLAQQTDTTSINKNTKYDKRYIHPKTCYLSVSGGSSYINTFVSDQNDFLQNGNSQIRNSRAFAVFYEHGILKNFFAELGYSTFESGITIKRVQSFTEYNGLTRMHQFQLGLGYRIITKQQRHLASVHGGFFSGFQNQIRNDEFILAYSNFDPVTSSMFNYRYVNKSTERFTFGTYFGLSKDIRLSKDVRFFVRYIQQLGFVNLFEGNIQFKSPTLPFEYDANYRVRNSGGILLFGLKIQLFKKRLLNDAS